MPKYNVLFETTASYYIEVEADSAEEAEEVANDQAYLPYFPGGMEGDIGDWYIESVEEVDE